MTSPVVLPRYSPAEHGEAFWSCYKDPDYIEFFRADPRGLAKEHALNYESIINGQLYAVVCEGELAGFVKIFQHDPLSLSCQVGLLLFPEKRDKMVLGKKICAWAFFAVLNYLFGDFPIRKFFMIFLADRKDLEHSASRVGMVKEGHFTESTYCYGGYKDEVMYSAFKNLYEQYKKEGVI